MSTDEDRPLDIRPALFTGKRWMRHSNSYYDRGREQYTQAWRDAHRMFTREEALDMLHHRQWMEAELQEFNRHLGEVERERDILANRFSALMEINMIVDDVPIVAWDDDPDELRSSWRGWGYDGNDRSAKIWLNQHNRRTWGLGVNDRSHGCWVWTGDRFIGSDYPSRADARDAALRWVAHKLMPKERGRGT